MAKVTFNAITKEITVIEAPTAGAVNIDVQAEIYSEAKRQWLVDTTLNKFTFPFDTIGGESLGGTTKAGSYYFLRNDLGWYIKPYEADHELIINGNLFGRNPDLPFYMPTDGGYTVAIRLNTSSLTQQVETSTDLSVILQWLQADEKLTPTEAIRYDKDTKQEIWKKNVSGGNLLSTIELTEPDP